MADTPYAGSDDTPRLEELEFFAVEVPRTDGGAPVRSLLVRIADEAGAEGWGEANLAWGLHELAARRETLLSTLSRYHLFDIEELLALPALRSAPLRAAVEIACWDLLAGRLGQPLCRLWGGYYRHGLSMAVRLPAAGSDRTAELGWAMAEQGLLIQLLTASGRSANDLAAIAALRSRFNRQMSLRLDGNCSFDLEAALELCTRLESDGLEFLLDPLSSSELYAMASLARQTNVPLAAWRNIAGPGDVLAVVRSGAADVVVIDVERVGGPTAARKCAAIAEAAERRALLGGEPSVGIGTALKLHLAAATPALGGFCECAYMQLQDDVLQKPLPMMDDMLMLPQGPGLGIRVDRGKIEKYAAAPHAPRG